MKFRRYPYRACRAAAVLVTLITTSLSACAYLHAPKPLPPNYSIALHYDAASLRIDPVEVAGKPYIRLHHSLLAGSTRELGRPAPPQDEVFVVLPPDASNVRVAFQVVSSTTVARNARVEPLQPPRQTSIPQFS